MFFRGERVLELAHNCKIEDNLLMVEQAHIRIAVDNTRLRREVAFRQADVTRAARGAAAAGLSVSSIRIGRDGVIEVLTTQAAGELTDAFGDWKAKRDARRSQRN
jgi:hypothetical protein